DRTAAADGRKARRCLDLSADSGCKFGIGPDECEYVGEAEQPRAGAVGPQHLVQRNGQHNERVARGKPRAYRLKGGDIEERIGSRAHGPRRSRDMLFVINALVIIVSRPAVQISTAASPVT